MKILTEADIPDVLITLLDECNPENPMQFRRADGRVYRLTMNEPRTGEQQKPMGDLPDFEARQRALFPVPIPLAQIEMVERAMRGE